MHFAPKLIYFNKLAKKSKNRNQLVSIYRVYTKEPKTPGTARNHLIKCLFFFVAFNKLAQVKKMNQLGHITCLHKGANNTMNRREPFKNYFLLQNLLISISCHKIKKWEPARFHVTCFQKGAKKKQKKHRELQGTI